MKNLQLKKGVIIVKSSGRFLKGFLRWALISAIIGCVGGFIGTGFHLAVGGANQIREAHPSLILLLPIGGLCIVGLYKLCSMFDNHGTDDIIEAVRTDEKILFRTAPLIFVSTVITHLLGGSAGREGAALQLGGSIGYQVGKIFRLDLKDRHLVVMCGMSALFSALFGTPLTSAVFAMEVISVGIMYYSGLIPCMFSALTAYGITCLFNIEPTKYTLSAVPDLGVIPLLQTVVIAMLCAGLSVLFCILLHGTAHGLQRILKNPYLRIAVGGAVIVGMTYLVRCTDYNGAGGQIIERAIGGTVKPEAFALKMIFTAVTIGAGYKGGEIVPTFFVGATFGCLIGGLIGMAPGFGAAVGMIAMFCGMLNCPIAAIILSVEMFGQQGLILFAAAAAVSYVLSGYYGLYRSQKIMYSKLRAEYINKNTR